MTDLLSKPTRRIDIGEVMNRTFGAIGANFPVYFVLSLLLAGIPGVLIVLGMTIGLPALFGQMDAQTYAIVVALVALAAGLLSLLPSYILIGAITHGSMVHFNKGRSSFGECFATGLRLAIPLICLGIVSAIGYFLWFLLLVIPAILAMTRWAVIVPAMVVDRTGVFESFRRSADLTRDNRWRVFLLGLLYMVISSLISGAVNFAGLILVGGMSNLGDPSSYAGDPYAMANYTTIGGWVMLALQILYTAINTMIVAAGTSALYYELRVMKEGATSNDLAKVFE